MAAMPLPANIRKLMNAPANMQQLINDPAAKPQPASSTEPESTKAPTNAQQHVNAPASVLQPTGTPANMQRLLNAPASSHQLMNRLPVSLQQMARGDRQMFSSADDNLMMRQVQETHAPDGRDLDVKPLLRVVEDIFNRASPITDRIAAPVAQTQADIVEDRAYHSNAMALLEALAYIIDRTASEISWKSSGGDAHSNTISMLSTLSYYPWDAKLVITLAAFALNYGEFWLLAQSYTSNQLAKSVATLKQLPDILEHSSVLKPRFDAIADLIRVMIDIAKCIVDIKDLPAQYISTELTALSTAIAHIPMAVYWTIRSILACATQITGLIGVGREQMTSTPDAWELSTLAHKLSNMHSHLLAQLNACRKHINEKKFMESYQNLVHLFEVAHIDNMKVLKALLNAKDDPLPLVDGDTKRRVSLDVLRRKNVLLLVSDLDMSPEQLNILEQIYNESRKHPTWKETQYEVVWLPAIDPSIPWTESRQIQFDNLQSSMTWYTVHSPSLIDRAVVKFVKDKWHFQKKHILVVLDPQGRVACPNALHMMWIWGTLAFPFTTSREEILWNEESWRLELLVDNIDPVITNWLAEGRYICLYGGDDIEWIRKFVNNARAVAKAANIPLELVYVGKSNPKDRVRRNISTIIVENLGHCWQEAAMMWYFWVRLESMWHSKNQLERTIETDAILQQIMTILAYDSSAGGWALLSRGTDVDMAKAKGPVFLTGLLDYSVWKEQIQQKGFLPALQDYLKEIQPPHHCMKFALPRGTGRTPERVACPECGKTMESFLMYECCDE